MGVLYVPVELTVLFYFFKRSTRACRDLFTTAAFSFTTTTTPAAVLGDLAAAQPPPPTLRGRRRLVPDTDLAEATATAGVVDNAVRDRKLRDGVPPAALLLSADWRRHCGEEDASAALFFRTR